MICRSGMASRPTPLLTSPERANPRPRDRRNKIASVHLVTSNASTATLVPPDRRAWGEVVVLVTVITSVCVTSGARPEAENTGSE